jgi:phospholipase A-2-activating protein
MEKKIQELNQTVSNADESSGLQPDETSIFQEIYQMVSTSNTGSLTGSHIQAVTSIIDRWPATQVFPGLCTAKIQAYISWFDLSVIDLLRLILASNPLAFKSVQDKQGIIRALFKSVQRDQAWVSPLEKSRETNLLLVLRTIANMFQLIAGKVPASWTSDVGIYPGLQLI